VEGNVGLAGGKQTGEKVTGGQGGGVFGVGGPGFLTERKNYRLSWGGEEKIKKKCKKKIQKPKRLLWKKNS